MNQKIVDLHVHSKCSDGTMTPTQLVKYALQKGLSAFALTDHDTFAGIQDARDAAASSSLEVIPGIEFSTVYHNCDVHVVGLDIDPEHPAFCQHMENFQRSRTTRNEKIISAMQKAGFDISMEALRERFGDIILTRAHFARYLLEHGYISTMKEAFDKYIGEGKPFHIPREKITPHEVVKLIYQTGGIPVLAHPMLYKLEREELEQLIRELIPLGLIGIEGIYSTYTSDEELYVRDLAARYGLTLSGGSDFHGDHKPGLDLATGYGNLCITYDILEQLRVSRRNNHV